MQFWSPTYRRDVINMEEKIHEDVTATGELDLQREAAQAGTFFPET